MPHRPKPPAGEPDAAVARGERNLARQVVDEIGDRIRDGRLVPGDKLPTEAGLMARYGVSRTVVREALSRLQARGQVRTRHGIGTFVVGPGQGAALQIAPQQLATLEDVVAVLELRLGIETEAAALAARRRGEQHLRVMRGALADFRAAVEAGQDAVAADLRFHLEIARATGNVHYAQLMGALGAEMIPRARLQPHAGADEAQTEYLRRVNAEHQSILEAIEAQDSESARAAMRTHLANSRERRRRLHGALSSAGRATAKAPARRQP